MLCSMMMSSVITGCTHVVILSRDMKNHVMMMSSILHCVVMIMYSPCDNSDNSDDGMMKSMCYLMKPLSEGGHI